ncbi:MAG: prolyl oligopeptidase family serine peptidase, partial [Acidobacteria bacterium]|nr:prolyl oligopeptidase family serine peptidase [Acidobacteriota bacterium]
YAADGPAFTPRRLTSNTIDDGQELTQLSFSNDGKTIVYVRGGDHGSNRGGDVPPDPSGNPVQPRVQIWSVPVSGGAPKLVADGDGPVIAPSGEQLAFVRNRAIWFAPVDGSRQAQQAFYARGASESPTWSPDGRTLAFVSNRADHSFIGLFTPQQPIRFIAPSTSRDSMPVWSPDGKKIAFLRQPGTGGTPRPPLARNEPQPWEIVVADIASDSISTAVTSGGAPVDRILQNPGGIWFRWADGDRLVFTSYRDGFPHLYSIEHPGAGGRPVLLTPGSFMVEHLTLTPDGRFVVYNANTGADRNDFNRRHLFKVPVNAAAPVPLTSGAGIEWSPVVTADGQTAAFLGAGAQQPPMPSIVPLSGGTARPITQDLLAADFPAPQLVTPEHVTFRAGDGVEAQGQLFKPAGGAGRRRPAVVYVHGGGPRQMMLGWHNRWEYANDYGANQYLVSRGFVVLSVDYRLSVGYGQAFQFPDNTGARGASEYRDILAAGRYLQSRPDVDPARIGIWGASLGGYLTALALGRNSDVFAAGVDIHGVHDRLQAVNTTQLARAIVGDGIVEADLKQALKVAFESSPIAAVPAWKSPVLLIHGDDDRTVDFHQTVDLARRLREKRVRVEELVLPDDVHDSLLWRNWIKTITAMSQFFEQTLEPAPARGARNGNSGNRN